MDTTGDNIARFGYGETIYDITSCDEYWTKWSTLGEWKPEPKSK